MVIIMSTSSNVTEYTITKNNQHVGNFRKHNLCRFPDYAELLKYQPLVEYEIKAWGYDDEEELWEEDVENLESFLKGLIHYNKYIHEFFEGNKSHEEILKNLYNEYPKIFKR
jgi:hypothetical protein